MTSAEPERHPTAQEAVLARLRHAIVSGELTPGEQIRQEALAERFGVSRVPLREALKILQGEGSVVYRPRRGYFVADLSLADLLEVYRIRELLEAEAVRVALPRLTDADVAEIAEAVHACEQAGRSGDLTAMTAHNRRLHFALVRAAGMPRLERLIRILWDATDIYRSLYYASADNRAAVDQEHRAILAAVAARDADAAVLLLDEHRAHAVQHLRAMLGT